MKSYSPPKIRSVHRITDTPLASLKIKPEDFVVEEVWELQFSGEGEHLYLYVEKIGQNTQWVAKALSRAFSVSEKSVGYSGLKDRQAITRQWFSLPSPHNESVTESDIEGIKILSRARHSSKLRRGSHQANRFQIRLRDIDGDRDLLQARLQSLAEQGFPNYFGAQRFGHSGNNLKAGFDLSRRRKLVGHPKRGIYLSAMRSALFNEVLAAQILAGKWPSIYQAEEPATGPLWGRGRPLSAEIGAEIEAKVVASNPELCDLLEHGGLSQERRNLVCKVADFEWQLERDDLFLSFSLPPGSYATVLVEELVALRTTS